MNTKRKVLCIFSLILYLLATCTILSSKIEEEMTTLVRVERKTSSKRTGRSMTLESRSIFIDDEGNHLYEVREGSGWENGLRAYEVPSFGLDAMGGEVSLWGVRDYVFIRSASRQPQEGELAKIVEEFETVNDQYLLYYHDGIPNVRDFPSNTELIAQSDNAFLLDVKDASLPFFPHMVKTQTVVTDMADRIFSLTEVAQFLEQLPLLMVVCCILAAGIIFLVLAWIFSIYLQDNKWWGWFNLCLAGVFLLAIAFLLNYIDLPASMMPVKSILNLEYYKNKMILIGEELECMAEQRYNILGLMSDVQQQCACIFSTGILFVGVIVICEVVILWNKSSWGASMKIKQYFRKVKFYDKILWEKYLAVLGVVSLIMSLISFFVTAQNLGVCSVYLLIFFCVAIIGIFLYMWWEANQIKHADLRINNTKVCVAEGDIWALMKKEPSDRAGEVSVIAVNDYYDTIVDDRIVAAKSLHGQYINKLIKEKKLDALNAVIENDNVLNEPNNCEKVSQRAKGRQMRYAIGSVVEFESYVLSAFTKFDEHNKAFLSAEEYTSFWMHFWENIDGIYAGRTINIPLIGAGITRFRNGKPSKQELLEIMLWTLKISGFHNTYADRQINIIIYPPDANEIDFYHIQHNRNYH